MPRLTTLVLGFITAILCGSLFAANTQPTIQSFNKMPLAFTQNNGQWDSQVLFRANAGGATMWFTKEGVTYQFTRHVAGHSREGGNPGSVGRTFLSDPGQAGMPILPRDTQEKDSIEQLVLTTKFVGANANPEVVGEGLLEYKCNYFLGNDPSKWHTDVPNYEAITLKDIYPGIDLKYSGDGNGQAAYEFVVAPGADIAQIKVAYEGSEGTLLDPNGRLILKTKWGDMTAAIGSGVNGTGLASPRFALSPEHTLGFAADGQSLAQANSGTLTLSYSSYLGAGDFDWGTSIAVDDGGNAYVTGTTNSPDFPTTPGAYDTTYNGGYDAFVAKFSPSGALIYSTYLGGENADQGWSIAVDGSGNAYVTGATSSSDFPTLNPFQGTYGGGSNQNDVFVAKLSGSGNSLIYSTYLGGVGLDQGHDIAVDDNGNAYVTGGTTSSNFPTQNPYQATNQGGGWDAFVTKLSSFGNDLIYGTYLGGGGIDQGYGIAVDDSGNAYVTGSTTSSNFPTLNSYQTYQGDNDVFATKLSNSGNGLIYSTYLGGGDADIGLDIAIDGSGNAYVTGRTESSDFPTLNPYQSMYQGGGYYGWDAFVTKLSSSGNSLIFSTYLGGADDDTGLDIAIDGSGNAYVTGYTNSSDFPTFNPYQTGAGVFVTKFSSLGTMIYGTCLNGGSGHGIAVDNSGNAYVTGTAGLGFPTLNPYQAYQGGTDAFVTKLSWTTDYLCGDADGEGTINIADVVFLINYIFTGWAAPNPLAAGDADCSGRINIADVVYLIRYIFSHGPAPCAECG